MEASHCRVSDMQPHLNDVEDGLARVIADAWRGDFRHSYSMPSPKGRVASAWCQRHKAAHPESVDAWTCSNLEDAANQYFWPSVITADVCREFLADALGRDDPELLRKACDQVFLWGGVGRRKDDASRRWVMETQAPVLLARIRMAVDLLKANSDSCERFDGRSLLMNSAMTKVYAFADPTGELAIYDGRVGAALGILVVRYCRAIGLQSVPTELRFGWYDSQVRKGSRNPSTGEFHFPSLGARDSFHARCMWRASRILGRASYQAGCSLLDLERALFMVGYDVRSSI